MDIKVKPVKIRTIRQNDPRFTIYDDLVTCPRASVEVSSGCPNIYRDIIGECLERGWLKPVAHITERELLFMGLSND